MQKQVVLDINPRHHQGIGDLGKGLKFTSRAEDHVIESFELEGHPAFLGIGWHPEDRALEDDKALFRWFDKAIFHWFAEKVRASAKL